MKVKTRCIFIRYRLKKNWFTFQVFHQLVRKSKGHFCQWNFLLVRQYQLPMLGKLFTEASVEARDDQLTKHEPPIDLNHNIRLRIVSPINRRRTQSTRAPAFHEAKTSTNWKHSRLSDSNVNDKRCVRPKSEKGYDVPRNSGNTRDVEVEKQGLCKRLSQQTRTHHILHHDDGSLLRVDQHHPVKKNQVKMHKLRDTRSMQTRTSEIWMR